LKEYLIKTGLLDRQRKLVLAEEYLEWENRDFKGKEFSRIDKSCYADFKHGMVWIVWYKFTVGREYSITIKDIQNKELSIKFRSYFRLNNESEKLYSKIVNDIWSLYHLSVVDKLLDEFYEKGETEVHGFTLKSEGIELREGTGKVPWNKVATKDYFSYSAIYHQDVPAIHCRVSYNEFGSETLWSVIRTILKDKAAMH